MYQKDHLIRRDTQEIIAWCGRPLQLLGTPRKDDSIEYSARTGKGTLCSECKTKEKEFLSDKRRDQYIKEHFKRSAW